MCPFCFATVAWIAAGVTSAGGLSALAVNTLRKNQRQTNRPNSEDGKDA
jgi:hypothetical protein